MKNRKKNATTDQPDRFALAVDLARQGIEGQQRMTLQVLAEKTPERLRELADNALDFADRGIEMLREKVPDWKTACREGCSWCCRIGVNTTAPEVFRVANYLREHLSPGALEELRTRLATHCEATKHLPLDDRITSGRPCPLLENDRCGVYPVRPLKCRGWNSNDASGCERATVEPNVTVMVCAEQVAVCNGVMDGMLHGAHEAGLISEVYELTMALRYVFDHPEAEALYLSGKRAFPREMVQGSAVEQIADRFMPLPMARPNKPPRGGRF